VERQRERPLQGRLLPRKVLHCRVTLGGLGGRAFFPCVVDTLSQLTTLYNADANLMHTMEDSRQSAWINPCFATYSIKHDLCWKSRSVDDFRFVINLGRRVTGSRARTEHLNDRLHPFTEELPVDPMPQFWTFGESAALYRRSAPCRNTSKTV
jgi:hypothetical protein